MSADGLLENKIYGHVKATTSERFPFLLPGGKLDSPLMDWWALGALHLDPERLGSLVLQVLQELREQGDRRTTLPQKASIASEEGRLSKPGSQQTQPSCEESSEDTSAIQTVSVQPGPSIYEADRDSTDEEMGVRQDDLRPEQEDAQWTRRRHQDKEGKAGEQRGLSCEGGGAESLPATVSR